MICKKYVLKNFAKFTGKHLRQSLSFNKVLGWGLQLYQKRGSGSGVFLRILRNFLEHLFYRDHLRTFLRISRKMRKLVFLLLTRNCPYYYSKFLRTLLLKNTPAINNFNKNELHSRHFPWEFSKMSKTLIPNNYLPKYHSTVSISFISSL